MTHPTKHSYFFNYNGKGTNVCGGAEWLGDMNNFVGQLEYIIKKYHNEQL
jgi:flagellar biosynthesis chaperone FliJ